MEPTSRFVYLYTPRTLLNGADVRPSLDVNGNIIVTAFIKATATDTSSLPTYTPGNSVSLQTDTHGNLLVNDRKKTRTDDAISADPKQYTTVSTATPITADGTVFTIAAGEKGVIQNLDDAEVYIKLGASASSSSFNFVLPASTSANDGTSPPYQIDDYIGVVSIAAATGSPRVSAYKLS